MALEVYSAEGKDSGPARTICPSSRVANIRRPPSPSSPQRRGIKSNTRVATFTSKLTAASKSKRPSASWVLEPPCVTCVAANRSFDEIRGFYGEAAT